jgi:hypothetical protein
MQTPSAATITAAIWAQAERNCCSGAATPLWRALYSREATDATRAAVRRWVAAGKVDVEPVPAALRPFYL